MANRFAVVIEDDNEIARFFAIVLREFAFEVDVIANGRDAMERLPHALPDIIVLDLNLPGMSGVEILRRIRADDTLTAIPVIVVSANPHMIDDAHDMADLALQKPVSYDQLRALIGRFV